MQEFCPLCARNGIKSNVQAFQINFEEAVFMCARAECEWPFGYEELTFINRLVGKFKSEQWSSIAAKALVKKEPDPPCDLTSYTPPLTPGSEIIIKDVSNDRIITTDYSFNSDVTPMEFEFKETIIPEVTSHKLLELEPNKSEILKNTNYKIVSNGNSIVDKSRLYKLDLDKINNINKGKVHVIKVKPSSVKPLHSTIEVSILGGMSDAVKIAEEKPLVKLESKCNIKPKIKRIIPLRFNRSSLTKNKMHQKFDFNEINKQLALNNCVQKHKIKSEDNPNSFTIEKVDNIQNNLEKKTDIFHNQKNKIMKDDFDIKDKYSGVKFVNNIKKNEDVLIQVCSFKEATTSTPTNCVNTLDDLDLNTSDKTPCMENNVPSTEQNVVDNINVELQNITNSFSEPLQQDLDEFLKELFTDSSGIDTNQKPESTSWLDEMIDEINV